MEFDDLPTCFSDAPRPVHATAPSVAGLRALIGVLSSPGSETAAMPCVRVVAPETPASILRGHLLPAAHAADLIRSGQLQFRTVPDDDLSVGFQFVGPETIAVAMADGTSLSAARPEPPTAAAAFDPEPSDARGGRSAQQHDQGQAVRSHPVSEAGLASQNAASAFRLVTGAAPDAPEFAADCRTFHDDLWADATLVSVETPPLSQLRETMLDAFDHSFWHDLHLALEVLDPVKGLFPDTADDRTNHPHLGTVLLLTAARHGLLLDDLAAVSEDLSLFAKPVLSRYKQSLEDKGLVTDVSRTDLNSVGRPPMELQTVPSRLADTNPETYVAELASLLPFPSLVTESMP